MLLTTPVPQFHLLLVDDDVADAELFEEVFSEDFPEVVITRVLNGQEALDHLASSETDPAVSRPQLMVLDLNMPVMNGHEFLQRARAHDAYRSIPVLVLSTSAGVKDVQRSYHNFASGYAVKPASYNDLRALIQRVSDYWRGAVILPRIDQLLDGPSVGSGCAAGNVKCTLVPPRALRLLVTAAGLIRRVRRTSDDAGSLCPVRAIVARRT